jgi:hypothetical protein
LHAGIRAEADERILSKVALERVAGTFGLDEGWKARASAAEGFSILAM